MAIKQLTVFVENRQGALVEITDLFAANHVDMRALSIADTQDFGILRVIVNDTDEALRILRTRGHLMQATDVIAVKISDAPGKLSAALHALNVGGVNVEYLYAFLARTARHAYVVLRVADNAAATAILEEAGFHMVAEEDIKKL
ncbi:MAG: amino acid-binding protein [Clostridia bacterium]|nr:amino acid-binding protein [Clostridia bacterium]